MFGLFLALKCDIIILLSGNWKIYLYKGVIFMSKKTCDVFTIGSNPVGLGAKVLCSVPIPEQTAKNPVDIKGKSQHTKKSMLPRGSKRNV